MKIEYHNQEYYFRECDVKGRTAEEIVQLAEKTGNIQYEPNGFVWLVVPEIGYGRRKE